MATGTNPLFILIDADRGAPKSHGAMELTPLTSPAPSKRCDSLFEAQRVNARVDFVRLDVGGERRICRLAVGR
jgi:hypothetical protein